MDSFAYNTEALRREVNAMLGQGFNRGYPLELSVIACRMLLDRHAYPQPADLLAFASRGKISDAQVTDWTSPYGGEAAFH